MQNLKPIEYKNIRVLSSEQLSNYYNVDNQQIIKNFNNNKSKYIEGKHYFCLKSKLLKEFKSHIQNLDLPINKYSSSLYLWTEHGVLLHAKSLGTDEAWTVYEKLVDTYFRFKEAKERGLVPFVNIDNLANKDFADYLIKAGQVIKEQSRIIDEQEEELIEIRPKAEAYDDFLDVRNCITMTQAAKTLYPLTHVGRNKLFSILRERKVLNKYNEPYQKYLDEGYFLVRQVIVERTDSKETKSQTLVTTSGLEFIRDLFRKSFSIVKN